MGNRSCWLDSLFPQGIKWEQMRFNRDRSRVWPLHSITPSPLAPWTESPSPGQLPEPPGWSPLPPPLCPQCIICSNQWNLWKQKAEDIPPLRRPRSGPHWCRLKTPKPVTACVTPPGASSPARPPLLCSGPRPLSAPSLTVHAPDPGLCYRCGLTLNHSHPMGGHGSSLPPSMLPGGPCLPFHSATAPSISQD